MQYFPVFLTANQINALVIGGGDVAARKIELLLKTPAKISVMSANISDSVQYLIDKHGVNWIDSDYRQGYMADKNLVIAATDDSDVNNSVYEEATQHNIMVNVVDEPALCSYITPAIIDRSPMIIAMCSSGKSPILLRMLREKVERMLPEGYGKLAEFSGKFRDTIKENIKKLSDRRTFWENALTGTIGNLVLNNKEDQAETELHKALSQGIEASTGQIHIIHCNNDPDNLTLKAHRAMQFADLLLFDKNINPSFIEYVRRDADKFELSQSFNEDYALEQALKGNNVILLIKNHKLNSIDSELPQFTYQCGQ